MDPALLPPGPDFVDGLATAGPDFFGIHLLAVASLLIVLWSTLTKRQVPRDRISAGPLLNALWSTLTKGKLPRDLISAGPLLLGALAVSKRLPHAYRGFYDHDYRLFSSVVDSSRSLLVTCIVCTALGLISSRVFERDPHADIAP